MKKTKGKEKRSVSEQMSYAAALFFFGIFLLLPGTQGYLNITHSKFIYFSVAIITLVLFVIADRICNPRIGVTVKDAICRTTIDKYFLYAFIVWSFISNIFSDYSFDSTFYGQTRYEGFYSLVLYAVLYLIVSYYGRNSRMVLLVVGAVSIIYSGIAVLQFFDSPLLYPEGTLYYRSWFISTTGHHDVYSGVASLFVPVLLCSYVYSDRKERFIFLPGLFMLTAVQFLIKVDSGKMGILAGVFVIIPFVLDTKKHAARFFEASAVLLASLVPYAMYRRSGTVGIIMNFNTKAEIFTAAALCALLVGIFLERISKKDTTEENIRRNRLTVAGILVLLIAFSLVFVYLYKGDNELLCDASKLLHGNIADEIGNYRGYIWKSSFEIIRKHPLMGSGTGTFASEFIPYNAGYARYYANTIVDSAHNNYIQIAVCQGIIGLCLYLGFLASVIVRTVKSIVDKPYAMILLGGVIGYMVYEVFVFSIAIVTPLFWAMLGLLRYETGPNCRI